MDCQKLFAYGIIILISIYLLKDFCGFNSKKVETMADFKVDGEGDQVEGDLPSDPESYNEASFHE